MANDPLARKITLNYEGGSLTMTQGNYLSLFGDDSPIPGGTGVEKSVSVKAHTRVRSIGGGTTNVAAYTANYIQWPTSARDNAAGGEAVVMEWIGSEGQWDCRVSGPLWKLGKYLSENSTKAVWFHNKGGKAYGPFQKAAS